MTLQDDILKALKNGEMSAEQLAIKIGNSKCNIYSATAKLFSKWNMIKKRKVKKDNHYRILYSLKEDR